MQGFTTQSEGVFMAKAKPKDTFKLKIYTLHALLLYLND